MNFRDLSRNCMARGKALYEGHAVAAVAAASQAIADRALELIDVKYEVLPHVIDVEAAMADDAPILHDDLFTANVEPKPTKPSNIAKRRVLPQGRHRGGLQGRRGDRRRPLYHRAGAPGLHRAACLPVQLWRRWPEHDLQLLAGPVHDARLRREAARHRHCQHPRHAGGDRRRVRRQDAGLSGAAGARAVEEVRPPGEDADDAGRRVPRLRPDLRRRDGGQDSARRRTAPSSPLGTC